MNATAGTRIPRAFPELADGAVRILDGGVGTELQKRGAIMSPQAWCGPAGVDGTARLEAVHRDFLAAGADVITANTYAGLRTLLAMDGYGDRFEEINRGAVRAAHAARRNADRPDARIAGSLSHRGAIEPGEARPSGLDEAATHDAMREMAVLLAEEGCDFIVLEMMYRPDMIPVALEAARSTGLPVWAGFSARRGTDGRVVGFGPERDAPFADLVAPLRDMPVEGAAIMHTRADVISDALAILREAHDGPVAAYPDSGRFASPNWEFEAVMPPEALFEFASGWCDEGVQLIGGCCGLGPEHIAALAPLRR